MIETLGFIVIWSLGLMVGIALIAAFGTAVVLTTAFVADFLKKLFGEGNEH